MSKITIGTCKKTFTENEKYLALLLNRYARLLFLYDDTDEFAQEVKAKYDGVLRRLTSSCRCSSCIKKSHCDLKEDRLNTLLHQNVVIGAHKYDQK
jgi:hypothetical protein